MKLIEEEAEEAKKAAEKEKDNGKKSGLSNTDEEVETPRSKSDEEVKKTEEKKDKPKEVEGKKGDEKVKKLGLGPNEMIKFGGPRGEGSSTSKAGAGIAFVHLNTIEEERYETHTSNYMDSVSGREDSKLMSSNNLRAS